MHQILCLMSSFAIDRLSSRDALCHVLVNDKALPIALIVEQIKFMQRHMLLACCLSDIKDTSIGVHEHYVSISNFM